MVGDVNIYMNDLDDSQMAEIEIMIAETKRALRRLPTVKSSKRLTLELPVTKPKHEELLGLIGNMVTHM
uniref:Uncharacterized protein n=1 Tax=Vitis vinifera TaxID=29760 RepID=A5BS70_VITVI|nr:hypothetical protein VITISV_015514 [Vitis vinifera]